MGDSQASISKNLDPQAEVVIQQLRQQQMEQQKKIEEQQQVIKELKSEQARQLAGMLPFE